jgi:hypothetical protein
MSRHGRSQPDRYDRNSAADSTGAAPSVARSRAGHPADVVSLAFPPDEWALLTHLPAQVVVAATSTGAEAGRRTVMEGLAGIEAIAGGRAFDSDLVRAVVAAIFAEPDQAERGPAAGKAADRPPGLADVLANCRWATAVLAARADPADSASYRQWLQSIAARVCEAARSGSVAGLGERLTDADEAEAERLLIDDLGAALSLA